MALFPTPTARDAKGCGAGNHPEHGGPTLPNFVRGMWPTPKAHDAMTPKTPEQVAAMKKNAPKRKGGGPPGVSNLNEAVLYPTPTARDAGGSGGYQTENGRHGTTLTDATVRTASRRAPPRSPDGMVLNPRFVEAMMGFQDGHTACDFSGIRSSSSKPRSRGGP